MALKLTETKGTVSRPPSEIPLRHEAAVSFFQLLCQLEEA